MNVYYCVHCDCSLYLHVSAYPVITQKPAACPCLVLLKILAVSPCLLLLVRSPFLSHPSQPYAAVCVDSAPLAAEWSSHFSVSSVHIPTHPGTGRPSAQFPVTVLCGPHSGPAHHSSDNPPLASPLLLGCQNHLVPPTAHAAPAVQEDPTCWLSWLVLPPALDPQFPTETEQTQQAYLPISPYYC